MFVMGVAWYRYIVGMNDCMYNSGFLKGETQWPTLKTKIKIRFHKLGAH